MSTLVITTKTGTLRASAMPRCSLPSISIKINQLVLPGRTYLLMPIKPLFAATMSRQ